MKKAKVFDIVTIILLLILAVLIYCVIQLKVLHKPYINLFGHTVFQVITGSMEDTIKINDVVIVKITKDVKVNDIITYEDSGNYVTHRVIRQTADELVTKGDANNAEDDPIKVDRVVGKVVFILTNVSIWINVFKTPKVIIAIIISIILLSILFKKKM